MGMCAMSGIAYLSLCMTPMYKLIFDLRASMCLVQLGLSSIITLINRTPFFR